MLKECNKISILMRLIKLIERKNNIKPKSLFNQHNKQNNIKGKQQATFRRKIGKKEKIKLNRRRG